MEFITKEEWEQIRNGSADEAVNMLNEVFSRVHNRAVEQYICNLPSTISRLFASVQAQTLSTNEFYEKNPEFKNHRDVVMSTIEQVESDNPDKSYENIFTLAEPIIRANLSHKKNAETIDMKATATVNLNDNGEL